MVTLGKRGSLHARRTALAKLRQKKAVRKLFDDIAPRSVERNGGYTRIVKLGQRKSDSAAMAFIEWVDTPMVATEDKSAEEKKPKQKEAERKPKQIETKREEVEREEPTAKKEGVVAPPEEPKPKKRRWFGRKSGEEK
jgi:large subunit ribosomal protein L17